jgi:DNA-binding SARP family transcriptional activator
MDIDYAPRSRLEIALLGGFAVSRGGTPVKVAPGRPSLLIKVLGLAGGSLPGTEAAEALWPGVEAETARRRLRNVLHRLRDADGALVERDGDRLRLPAETTIDTERFETDAQAALASGSFDARAAGRALEGYTGELLPGEHADWVGPHRERLRSLLVALLDGLAEHAETRDEFGEAARLLRRAIELDRFDERRYLLLAQLLSELDRRGAALSVLFEGETAMAELGLRVSEGFDRLAARLREPAGAGSDPLPARDYEAALALIGDINGAEDIADLRAILLATLPSLVPATHVAYSEILADGRPGVTVVDPDIPDELKEAWDRLAQTNPLFQRYLQTQDGRPYRFSDVIARDELRAMPLYQELYGSLGIEHQIAFTLPAPRGLTVGIVLSRGAPDFSERERALLDLARPHIIQAYRNVHRR